MLIQQQILIMNNHLVLEVVCGNLSSTTRKRDHSEPCILIFIPEMESLSTPLTSQFDAAGLETMTTVTIVTTTQTPTIISCR